MANATMVQNFTLPGEINCNFSVDWSTDNKISMCTAKCLYIFTSHSSPVESGFPCPLHKQAIPVPKEPLMLKDVFIPPNPYKYIKTTEDRENLHSILMDHTITNKPHERAELFRSFRCCRWSPKGAAKGGRCLLAALTMDHRLVLYEESDNEWKMICDLSEILKEEAATKTIVEENKKIEKSSKKKNKIKDSKLPKRRTKKRKYVVDSSDEDYDVTKDEKFKSEERNLNNFDISKNLDYNKIAEEIYRIAPTGMIWTGMFSSPSSDYEYCYLIVAMKSGHLQFWRVSPMDGRVVTVAYEWNTELGLITSMCWQQTSSNCGFIMCGSSKGILAFMPVSIRFDENQEPKVSLNKLGKVWDEEDQIPIDHITVLKIALKKYVIIAAKMNALVGCEIMQLDTSIVIKNVGHSYGLHKLPVTGMTILDSTMPQYRVLISTLEGLIVEIKVSLGNDEIKFQHEKISLDLDLKNNMIKGLVVSPNGLLCGLSLKTATYYDHLEKKEPLQFAMFITKPFEEIYVKLKSVLKPQFSFMPSSNSTITRQSDFLEIIRINMSCGTPLPEWLTAFIDQDSSTYESCSALELFFMRFILHAYISGLATTLPQDKEILEAKLFTVEAVIMRNYISKVFESCQDKIDLLTPAQGQSLLLMADWIFKEFQMSLESLYLALGYDVPVDVESLPPRETCRICKGDVKLDNIKTGQCVKNHMFARCCQSLLLCDVIPYRSCSSCKSVALQEVWSFGSICTYCGMPMI